MRHCCPISAGHLVGKSVTGGGSKSSDSVRKFFSGNFLKFLFLIILVPCSSGLSSGSPGRTVSVVLTPDSTTVLHNPLSGWVMYLGRNWDKDFWETTGYDNVHVPGQDVPVKVSDFASTAYLRTSWSSMEPERGKYFWQDPENNLYRLVRSVLERGMKVAFRVVVDGRDQGQNTPQYVFDSGAEYYLENAKFPDRKTPYPHDPVFRECYEQFIEAFALEFNDPSKTAFIDGYGLGKWGEGHNVVYEPGNAITDSTSIYKEDTMRWITGLYSRAFSKIPLVINYHRHIGHPVSEGRDVNPDSEKMLRIAIDNGYCLRSDAIGMNNQEWGYNDWERSYVEKWSHRLPIIMEGGWLVARSSWWKDPAGYKTPRDLRKGEFCISMEEKVNMMDFRAGDETLSWFHDAFDYIKRFVSEGGYRLYPDLVELPVKVKRYSDVLISHRWVNMGWGYCPNNLKQWNYKYKVAFALLDEDGKPVKIYVDENSDPSQWIKGSPVSYEFIFNTGDVPSGIYSWAVSIIDTQDNNLPGIELAVANAGTCDGWVKLSDVKIR